MGNPAGSGACYGRLLIPGDWDALEMLNPGGGLAPDVGPLPSK
jgi:hypothetical protein